MYEKNEAQEQWAAALAAVRDLDCECREMKLFDTAIVFIVSVAIAACASGPVDDELEIPEIVEVFACSDYCPGPKERYIKRVYDGVTDEEECRDLGGRPYTFIGWGRYTVCEAR